MTSETFHLGQIWKRRGNHGLLLAVKKWNDGEKEYTVFIFEKNIKTEWLETNMLISIKNNNMELIA